MKILADASLPGLETAFPAPFKLTKYAHQEEIPGMLSDQDILLCRSTLKVDGELIRNHSLKYVATASSGSDHIDHDYLVSKHIQAIDAKGCNAASVADYVMSCLAYLDKHKRALGKTAAVIGLGMVGSQVFKRLKRLGFTVKCYDPPKSDRESTFKTCSMEEILDCDVICIHAELQKEGLNPSFNLINAQILDSLKPNCMLINAARGGIVNEQDLIDCKLPLVYCTDVYSNEPNISKAIVERATLCTPHIAGHSLEAKYNAVTMVSHKLHTILGLPIPKCSEPQKPHPINLNLDWQDLALSIYNPINETDKLKSAEDLGKAFIELRSLHNVRHDFSNYGYLIL
ncbi:4-phosphoerythronate dehydrogenase [Legionella waltersii]|uniref:Erythronate-4-phosphate dehydrogenase n=1 Tax=Legionella waltersii TaxID=66969 RepID=A0A0W1ANJ1_9GAMM|nr:4-phosphoerythronate dehydrogenase [Legionella waltersii]KTD82907.1 erythronate-4-phosphate dehydrogenase [Legionella waltersii]SNV02212.1 erythronate-4-phosphate dehydrogenase [Legionella waltersii]